MEVALLRRRREVWDGWKMRWICHSMRKLRRQRQHDDHFHSMRKLDEEILWSSSALPITLQQPLPEEELWEQQQLHEEQGVGEREMEFGAEKVGS
jgi:hypothetical protein